jgi:hypothetical protein
VKKLFLLLLFAPVFVSAQCDLSIVDVNLNTYDVTVVVGEGEGCTVSMLQIGFHIPGNEQPLSIGPCVMNPDNFHPGWWYGALAMVPSSWADLPITNGDTIVMPLDNAFGADCSPGEPESNSLGCCAAPFLDYYLEQGECIEFVIWQINFSPTWYTADGGWAIGNYDGVSPFTAEYPDMDCNNSWYTCRENNPGGPVGSTLCSDTLCAPIYLTDTVYTELPPDTVYLTTYEVDTLVEYVYLEADTVYMVELDTLTLVDSIYFPVYLYDTTYIYLSDTVIEYEAVEVWINCLTGLECVDDPPGMVEDCDRVWIPNAFSPNNDGVNDGFYAVPESYACWLEWELAVYNRWGSIIWFSTNPEQAWYGETDDGEYYVEDGTYIWSLRAVGPRSKTLELSGSVTLLR